MPYTMYIYIYTLNYQFLFHCSLKFTSIAPWCHWWRPDPYIGDWTAIDEDFLETKHPPSLSTFVELFQRTNPLLNIRNPALRHILTIFTCTNSMKPINSSWEIHFSSWWIFTGFAFITILTILAIHTYRLDMIQYQYLKTKMGVLETRWLFSKSGSKILLPFGKLT